MMNEYDKRLNSCFNDGEIKTNFLGVCPWKRNVKMKTSFPILKVNMRMV